MQYIFEVPKDRIRDVADMLRYDSCFEVTERPETYTVRTVHFTRDRWASFGFVPNGVQTLKSTVQEDVANIHKALGFTRGIRFAQELLGSPLIQSLS